jgi:hypothetical protein
MSQSGINPEESALAMSYLNGMLIAIWCMYTVHEPQTLRIYRIVSSESDNVLNLFLRVLLRRGIDPELCFSGYMCTLYIV